MRVGGVLQNGLWCDNSKGFGLKVLMKEVGESLDSLGSTKGRLPCWYKVVSAYPEETGIVLEIKISQHVLVTWEVTWVLKLLIYCLSTSQGLTWSISISFSTSFRIAYGTANFWREPRELEVYLIKKIILETHLIQQHPHIKNSICNPYNKLMDAQYPLR